MHLGIKGKQVLGVTSIVSAVVVILSLLHLATLARVGLGESRSRAELIAETIVHRASAVVADGSDSYHALRVDPGLRSILEAAQAYSKNVTFAAIADNSGVAVMHADQTLEGRPIPAGDDLNTIGLCAGGILMSTVLSAMAAESKARLDSTWPNRRSEEQRYRILASETRCA